MVVEDDGEGIPEGEEERIFERFYQADRARARSGSGLGLSIARWIVEQHGGGISARNTRQGGAAFHTELPARVTADAPGGASAKPAPGTKEIPHEETLEATLPTLPDSFSSNP
jgi:hypothetical protein